MDPGVECNPANASSGSGTNETDGIWESKSLLTEDGPTATGAKDS